MLLILFFFVTFMPFNFQGCLHLREGRRGTRVGFSPFVCNESKMDVSVVVVSAVILNLRMLTGHFYTLIVIFFL